MQFAENRTVAKSLSPLRRNTYKSLILSYSADFSVIFTKKLPMHPKTGGKGRINDIAIRYVAKLSSKGVSTVQRVKRLKIHNHSNKTINFTFFSKRGCAIVA